MHVKPIQTKKDHQAALARIEQLWDATPNTPDGNELEALITQVQAFEDENYPIAPPNATVDIPATVDADVKEELLARLRSIESKMRGLPTLSPIEAIRLLNVPCRHAEEAKKVIGEQANLHALFAFTFDNEEDICIPAFQFDRENHCVLPTIPAIAKHLHPLSDWGIAHWLMSYDNDLEMTPMKAVLYAEKADDLMDLAELFRNSSTLRDLSHSK